MKRVLLTGVSGVGKSTVTRSLAERGVWAVDLDCDDYSHWVAVEAGDSTPGTPVEVGRDWVWNVEKVRELLFADRERNLVVSGCSPNMGSLMVEFYEVVLLTAPKEVLVERLRSRTTNDYGKQPGEIERVMDLVDEVEPLLRRGATLEIDTSASLDEVCRRILLVLV